MLQYMSLSSRYFYDLDGRTVNFGSRTLLVSSHFLFFLVFMYVCVSLRPLSYRVRLIPAWFLFDKQG
ncbi:hypothetical protein P8452_67026 [Trifolium repens]|nr:hypothetical protein QL285_088853 [Trifolium repens]WJX84450.1 hypothetical protein P8452_67026 [Trifolium repens]